jgi:hypothetical protein
VGLGALSDKVLNINVYIFPQAVKASQAVIN